MPLKSFASRAAVVLLLFIFAPAAVAAQQGHSIRGKVRDSSGNNVSRVIVDLQTGNGAPAGQTTANNEGDFFFDDLTQVSYVVTVRSPDHTPASESVEFGRRADLNSPGETRTVEITLLPRANHTPRPAPGRVALAQSVPERAREAFDRGMRLAREGKPAEAEAAVREAVAAFPDYFDARLWLANELVRTGRLDDAVPQLEVARRVSPSDERVYLSFGNLLVLKKNYAVAAAVFAEAARLNPTSPQPLLQRGMALVEYAARIDPAASKKSADERAAVLDDAERALAEALRLSGRKLGAARLQLARVYEKRGDRARAAGELDQYLRDNPSAPNAPAIRQAVKTLRAPSP